MERRLIATAPTHRFWRATLEDDVIVIRSGAAGTPGAQSRIPTKSAEAAAKTLDALVQQRLRDGFVEEQTAVATGQALSVEDERSLLADDGERWLVFSDQLLEAGDTVRGELVRLHVAAAKRTRGSIGKAKDFIRTHYDDLVGVELAAFHKQASIEWAFGYARVIKLWSGPYAEPIGESLEAALNSPASRFLKRLEFGSPGTEGKYDAALRTLASLEWPAHLNELSLGEFDVAEAFKNESAWPRLDSLGGLSKAAERIEVLELRAALNTIGKGLAFPNLRTLSLKPWRLDARLVTDLGSLDLPKLETISLTPQSISGTSIESLASSLAALLGRGAVTTVELRRFSQAFEVLELLAPRMTKVNRLVLIGARREELYRLEAVKHHLAHVVFETPESVTLAKSLTTMGFEAIGPSEETLEKRRKTRALREERERAREREDADRYEEIAE